VYYNNDSESAKTEAQYAKDDVHALHAQMHSLQLAMALERERSSSQLAAEVSARRQAESEKAMMTRRLEVALQTLNSLGIQEQPAK
jgi:hypothetical protein